jgi:hypothetical protein
MERPSHRYLPSTIPADASVMSGAVQLLARVESLPAQASGALLYGAAGIVLVESRRVCWSAAAGMTRRFNKLLLLQRSPPLEESYVKGVLRECQATGKRLGEALLATGHITEEGLRAALFNHVVESIARIAQSGAPCDGFAPHIGRGYDPRFEFSTAEIFIALGARRDRALAAAAKLRLAKSLPPDARGVAFVRDASGLVVIAVEGSPVFRIPEILDVCGWAAGLLDVASVIDEDVRIATGTSGSSDGAVTWRAADLQFVAICPNRAASAMLVARLNDAIAQQEQPS